MKAPVVREREGAPHDERERSAQEVAEELGVTQQAVSKLEAKALRKARQAAEALGLTIEDVRS